MSIREYSECDYHSILNIEESMPNKVGSLIMEHFHISNPEDLKPSIIEGHSMIRVLKSSGTI